MNKKSQYKVKHYVEKEHIKKEDEYLKSFVSKSINLYINISVIYSSKKSTNKDSNIVENCVEMNLKYEKNKCVNEDTSKNISFYKLPEEVKSSVVSTAITNV